MNATLANILDLPVPALLIGTVLIVTLWGWIFPPVQRALMLNPYRIGRHGEVYRLLTAGWLHSGVMHLAFNMLTLYFFAGQAAQVLGSGRFLILYLTAVIVAFIPTTLLHRRDPGYNSLGASGAVAAVMFSAILLHPRLRLTLFFVPVPVPAIMVAVAYLAYSVWQMLGSRDDVNHAAHLSGAVYGALLTWLFEPARVERTLRTLF